MPPGAPQEALRGPLGSLGTLAWGSRGPGSFPSRPGGPPTFGAQARGPGSPLGLQGSQRPLSSQEP